MKISNPNSLYSQTSTQGFDPSISHSLSSALESLKQRNPEITSLNPFRTTASEFQLPAAKNEISLVYKLTK